MKKVFVTGASRGIGNAIAKSLLDKNYIVIGTATSSDAVEKLSSEGIQGYKLKLNNLNEIDLSWKEISKNHPDIDILINNAGFTRDNLILRMSEEEWNDVLNVHLNGMFRITKRVLKPMLKKRWGRIINLSSASAILGNKGQANYAAAKAGVEAFSRSLAREVGRRGITVNVVAPGFIRTDMTELNTGVMEEELVEQIPLGRFGETSEIAHLVSYLCSEESSYITGQTIHINGGLYM
jgi:3-oxoacyl-[acyl-carrier protein] reductase|tara:strand:+ start:1541 stop:2251 length:711 start_codon:yes stop_codon:yes gene_type:complete